MFQPFVHLDDNPPAHIAYELHLDPPYIPDGAEHEPSKWVAHYIGSAERDHFMQRVFEDHGGPNGARVLQVARAAGCDWHLVRTWAGGRDKEVQLKQQSGRRYCPERECAGDRAKQAGGEPRGDYHTRRQRREAQRAREAPRFEPVRNARDLTYDQVQEMLRGGPGEDVPEMSAAEQLTHIERLDAQWRRAMEAAPKVRELEMAE